MNKFRQWYLANAVQITWFIIGAMIMSGAIYVASGMYINALISFFIAWVNWYLGVK